jgi:RNA polymerase sigma factor (sigma-70 family)
MELSELIKECQEERLTAQKWLYDRFAVRFFLLCRRYLKTDEIAEECMMGGFLRIFKSISSFEYKNEAATIAWMKRIMVNECLQVLRKKEPFFLVAEEAANEMAVTESVLEQLNAEELFKLITKLPTGYRTVFNLYAVEGLKHQEIAAELGITEGTSKSQYNRARILLQQMLEAQNNHYNVNRKSK